MECSERGHIALNATRLLQMQTNSGALPAETYADSVLPAYARAGNIGRRCAHVKDAPRESVHDVHMTRLP